MGMMWQKLMVAAAAAGIQFVGGKTAAIAGSVSTNTLIAIDSGLTGGIASAAASGDFVIAAYAMHGSDSTLAITDGTTGYTLIGSELFQTDSDPINLRVAYKFITSDTDTTFGGTGDTARPGMSAIYVFRGVDTVTPMDVAAVTATAANSAQADPPSITPSTSGAFIVAVGAAARSDASSVTFTSSDLTDFLTEYSLSGSSSREVIIGIGQKDDWTSGAFNPAAFSISSNANNSWAAVTMALRPA